MGDANSGFLSVFEQRVQQARKRLKKELEKDKKDRSRHLLKDVIKQIKKWEKVLRDNGKDFKRCPHCGEKLEHL